MMEVLQCDRDLLDAIYGGTFTFKPKREREVLDLIAAHRLAATPPADAWQAAPTQCDDHDEAMVCTGCGTTKTIAHIRANSATAFTCCPERKMVPVRSQIAATADACDMQGATCHTRHRDRPESRPIHQPP